ncbi:MAG: M1 family metallopeptidase [Planctomycetes bacterium]|nr:M1 family metallopeptidase [Planctomycetota bacterium]
MLPLLFILALLPAQEVAPGSKPGERAERPAALPDPTVPGRGIPGIDVQHYTLELAIDSKRRFTEATATLELKLAEDQRFLELDFHHMFEVIATRVDGRLAEAELTPHRLRINPDRNLTAGRSIEVEVIYRGLFPQDESQGDVVGMLFDGHSVVAYLEPDGAHHWFPCNDHPSDKATFELIVDVPTGQRAAAIGQLIEEGPSPRPNHTRSRWRTDIPTATYLVALGVGPWVRIEREGTHMPIWDYCEEGDREAIEKSLAVVPKMMNFFEERFGPYPFEKYGHMLTRKWIGGMEDQTLSVIGREEALSGDQALLAHELAHQWFGNLVSPYQWRDLWLNEGWATWSELLWLESQQPKMARKTLAGWRRSTFRLAMREHPHTLAEPDPQNLFDGKLVYDKGAMVIHLLDEYLGREKFLQAARDYLGEFAHGNVATSDFQAAFEKATGEDLAPFFASWVHANTLPEIAWSIDSVETLRNTGEKKRWKVTVTAEQRNQHHPMMLELELRGTETKQRFRVPLYFREATVQATVIVPFVPENSVLDPDKRGPWVPAEPRQD